VLIGLPKAGIQQSAAMVFLCFAPALAFQVKHDDGDAGADVSQVIRYFDQSLTVVEAENFTAGPSGGWEAREW
jgi:hypothetical protein